MFGHVSLLNWKTVETTSAAYSPEACRSHYTKQTNAGLITLMTSQALLHPINSNTTICGPCMLRGTGQGETQCCLLASHDTLSSLSLEPSGRQAYMPKGLVYPSAHSKLQAQALMRCEALTRNQRQQPSKPNHLVCLECT